MLNKKGATTADILSYFIILLGGSITIMGIAYFVVAPMMGERTKTSVTENIVEFNEDLFLFNYLRYPVGEKTMTDLVVKAYFENEPELLKQETINFFNELYSKETKVCCKVKRGIYYWREREECAESAAIENCIKWQIYINDKLFIDSLYTTGAEKRIHDAYIPNYYNLEPINFKFIFY